MNVPRRLVLSLLVTLCVATAPAQSSPDKNSTSSQPLPALSQNPQANPDLFHFQLHFLSDEQGQASPKPSTQSEPDTGKIPALVHAQHILTLEQNEATCYTLRAYRVARETPESDSTRPAGYSTCQRASRFQLRTAVDSQEIAPR